MKTAEEGNNLIYEGIMGLGPFMAARFGSVELNCLTSYVQTGAWNENIKFQMKNNAGFFPTEDWALTNFCSIIIESLSYVNVLAEWLNENYLIDSYFKDLKIVQAQLRSVEPYYHANPWSKSLKDKRVLVIHPFEDSIKKQYEKRSLLFSNPDVLPEFKLDTIKAVQSIAGSKTEFKTWFEALDKMRSDILKKNFDVAIIGAGAYGLPLAGFIKSIGKKAIHMGGATQILFGIKGKRWDMHEDISKLYNENWVRPSADETPENYMIVEGGTYW